MDRSIDSRRRRALFRSRRRGIKESDLLLGGFAERHLGALSDEQLGRFEALLERSDPELLGWIAGAQPVPSEFDHDVMSLLKNFRYSL